MQLTPSDIFSRCCVAGCDSTRAFAVSAQRWVNRQAVQTLITATRSTS